MMFWQKGKHLIVEMDGIQIPQVHQSRFLGVLLDDELSWTPHINTIREKTRANKHLLLSRNFLNKECMLSLYYVHIFSHLTYSLALWGSMLSKAQITDLFKLQKACI